MKKKLIIAGGIVGVMVIGIIVLFRMDIGMRNPWLDGQLESATRGDLVIPVTATGTVEPAKLIQIKSKASGEVAKIHVVEGQMVKSGDILVELDPVDEKRNKESAQATRDRAASALEKAKVTLENCQLDLPLQTKSAEARLMDAIARFEDAKFKWEKMQQYIKDLVAGEVEEVTTKATYLAATAAKDLAEVEVQRAKNNQDIALKSARQDLKQAEYAAVEAQKNLDQATLRFEETTVRSRCDGMVYSIMIREGEMIQSGTMSLMGGTQLMTLADTRAMFVVAMIDEADIGAIRDIAPEYARPGKTQKLLEENYRAYAQQAVSTQEAEERGGGTATSAPGEDMVGLPVEVTVEAYRSQRYQGVIERILPEPQRVSNAVAFKVRIRLVGEDLEKLMGLQADLSFTTAKVEHVVLVKNEALHSEGRDCYVYVPVPGRPREDEKRAVVIGTTDGTSTEIKSGLEVGDRVYTKRPQKTEREKEKEKESERRAGEKV
jgi:multidrug efflux pump subunit AcrA (membrane-fusion protein)